MGLDRYIALLRIRRVQVVVVAMLVGGTATGLPLAMALVVSQANSLAVAGTVLGIFALALGFSSPVRGRFVDTRGQTAVLVPTALLHGACLIAFAAIATRGKGVLALGLLAAIAGASFPPGEASIRSLWRVLVNSESELPSAYALHAVLNEVVYVIGPLVVGFLAVVASPAVSLTAVACARMAGTLALAATPASRAWRSSTRSSGRLGPIASAGIRTLVLSNFAIGIIFGVMNVALVAFAKAHGDPSGAGLCLAALAAGSMAGGLAYGARDWEAPLERRLVVLYFVLAVALGFLVAAPSIPWLAAATAVGGLAIAPYVATEYALLDVLALPGTETEALNWLASSYAMGIAGGSILAGIIATQVGVRPALACASAAAGAALLVTLARFGSLAARVPPHASQTSSD